MALYSCWSNSKLENKALALYLMYSSPLLSSHFFLDSFFGILISMIHFPGFRAGKSGLKFDSEAVSDVLVVHGFSIGYKAEFTCSGYFPWSELLLSVPRW